MTPPRPKVELVILTGMSGAGHTTALKALEDLGYEAVDNLPFSLLNALISERKTEEGDPLPPLAVSLDSRTRGFSAERLADFMTSLRHRPDIEAQMVFIDCEDAVLQRRYTETRRRHPQARDRSVEDGIAIERSLLEPLKAQADQVIDSSEMTVHDLKRRLNQSFGGQTGMHLAIESFSYKRGLPRAADLVMDVRFLRNPHYDPALRALTGQNEAVGAMIMQDAHFSAFFDDYTQLIKRLLPRYHAEGKSYLTLAIGCTGGQHRSVFVAERLAECLKTQQIIPNLSLSLRHRDMPKEAEQAK